MRKQARRDSALDWVRSVARVTVQSYARRYGVDRYTAYDWVWVGDRRLFVVGHTAGGAPFGCYEDELEDLP